MGSPQGGYKTARSFQALIELSFQRLYENVMCCLVDFAFEMKPCQTYQRAYSEMSCYVDI